MLFSVQTSQKLVYVAPPPPQICRGEVKWNFTNASTIAHVRVRLPSISQPANCFHWVRQGNNKDSLNLYANLLFLLIASLTKFTRFFGGGEGRFHLPQKGHFSAADLLVTQEALKAEAQHRLHSQMFCSISVFFPHLEIPGFIRFLEYIQEEATVCCLFSFNTHSVLKDVNAYMPICTFAKGTRWCYHSFFPWWDPLSDAILIQKSRDEVQSAVRKMHPATQPLQQHFSLFFIVQNSLFVFPQTLFSFCWAAAKVMATKRGISYFAKRLYNFAFTLFLHGHVIDCFQDGLVWKCHQFAYELYDFFWYFKSFFLRDLKLSCAHIWIKRVGCECSRNKKHGTFWILLSENTLVNMWFWGHKLMGADSHVD